MKQIVLISIFLFLCLTSSLAQSLVVGEKGAELKVSYPAFSDKPDSSIPTYVEFFSIRSTPSKNRLSTLDRLATKYEGRINVMLISHEPLSEIEGLVKDADYSFIVALDDADKSFKSYNVKYLPFCVILDVRGRVLWFGNPSKITDTDIEQYLSR